MQLNTATDECRREYEILIDAVVNSQKGYSAAAYYSSSDFGAIKN
jgi:hypothetical protein